MEMPSLASDGSTFSIQHSSSAMSTAPLTTAEAASMGPSTLPIDSAATLLGVSGSAEQRAEGETQGSSDAPPEQRQSTMPVLEASHRGSVILIAFIEPRSGRFRVRPSEEVLQFADMDYTAVVRAVRDQVLHLRPHGAQDVFARGFQCWHVQCSSRSRDMLPP